MSAECSRCGADLVFLDYPMMECERCTLRWLLAEKSERLATIVEAFIATAVGLGIEESHARRVLTPDEKRASDG